MTRASLLRPLEAAADSVQRFIRVPEIRLLCVEAGVDLRRGVMQVLLGAEHLADNRSPLLPVGFSGAGDSDKTWEAATEALREAHEERHAADAVVGGLGDRPTGGQGSANFATQALQCAGAVQSPAQGLLLAVMPARGSVDAPWLRRLGEIVMKPQLAPVRFILLCQIGEHVADWVTTLDQAKVMHHRGEVDEADAVREAKAEIDAEERLGPGFRGAWPRGVTPPPLPSPAGLMSPESPAGDGLAIRDEGVIVTEKKVTHRMKLHVKRAAVAMREGNGPEAIREQAAARDLCLDAGRIRDAVTMELMLGSYMFKLQQRPLAVGAFKQAATRATEAEHWDLAAQAHVAAGSTHDADGQPPEALRSYREAIAVAKLGGHAPLALQSYYEAGQVALRLGLEMDCISLWADAIGYAKDLPRVDVSGTQARAIARELSELLTKHRRYSDARELDRLGKEF